MAREDADVFGNEDLAKRVYNALIGGSSVATVLVNTDLTVAWISESVVDLLGHPPQHFIGTSAIDLLHPDDLGPLAELIANEISNPASYMERQDPARLALNRLRFRHPTKGWVTLDMSANNETGNPAVNGFLLHLISSELPSAQDDVMEAILVRRPTVEIATMIATAVRNIIDTTDILVRIDDQSTEASRMLQQRADWLATTGQTEFVEETRSIWRAPALLDGVEVGMIAVAVDVQLGLTMWTKHTLMQLAKLVAHTARRDQLERQLSIEASCDPLTGLANRRTFFRRAESSRSQQHALLYIDLDGFKDINDRLGHDIGDAALVEAAKRINGAVRPQDLVSRFGGDEFTVWCAVEDHTEALQVGERIRTRLTDHPFVIDTHVVKLQATIGVAIGDVGDVDVLLRRADMAMLGQKQTGKGLVTLANNPC